MSYKYEVQINEMPVEKFSSTKELLDAHPELQHLMAITGAVGIIFISLELSNPMTYYNIHGRWRPDAED